MKPIILIVIAILVFLGILFFWKQSGGTLPEISRPSPMPPVVQKNMDELLHEFETEVIQNQPSAAALLRPGISEARLQQVETALGTPLHPELRALYRWHDGMERSQYLFPGYEFYSLEEALQLRDEANSYFREKGLELFMAHEANWLILFSDPAGDGYHYDFRKSYEDGGVFFVFRESAYRVDFPSLKNVLAGLIECYRQRAYQGSQTLDFGLEQQIMESFGRAEHQ